MANSRGRRVDRLDDRHVAPAHFAGDTRLAVVLHAEREVVHLHGLLVHGGESQFALARGARDSAVAESRAQLEPAALRLRAEVVRALAAPLANVDKITVVSTGNSQTTGMNKITGDVVSIAAQIPALFETLSGMKMNELLDKIQGLRNGDDNGAKLENGKK